MNELRWSVLICTLASRREKLKALLDILLPQVEAADGKVEVVGLHNNGEWPLGDIRQKLLLSARGTYTSYIDDDDSIAPTFVPDILEALDKDPDVVGFITEYSESGQRMATVYNSLQHDPHDTPGELFRDVTHVQPVRTTLSRQSSFRGGWPEDSTWRSKVRPLLKTEVYIPKVLYLYRHSWSDSVQGQLQPHTYTPRPEIDSSVFRWIDMDSPEVAADA